MLNTLSFPTGSQIDWGDCVDVIRTIPDNSIDLVLTDPPYANHYVSKSRSLPLRRIANNGFEAYALLDKALAAVYPKLKDNSWVFISTNWQAYPSMSHIVSKYFTIKNLLIWEKNAGGRGDLKGNWSYWHEDFIAACKGKRRELNGKREGNILKFNKLPTNCMRHPTEKPVPLLKYLIEKSTQPGEVVLDMFMGSGSTCEAADRAGRRYRGIDCERIWFEGAAERLKVSAQSWGDEMGL